MANDPTSDMPIRSENDDSPLSAKHAGEAHRPGFVDRLRVLLGLAPASVREDIEGALEEATGDVTPHERALLKNVLALHEMRVDDAMIPRADIVAVSQDATLREVLSVFRSAGHSRLPVFADTLDDPRGMVHIRDFVNHLARCAETRPDSPRPEDETATRDISVAAIDFDAPLSKAEILKPVLFVPRSMPALDLLVRMQAARTHMALVIDEYGGTDGLVSIEDIVEMIVGDIADEHDVNEEPRIESLAGGDYLVDAKADLDDVAQTLGVDFRMEETPAEVTTLGGLVAWLAGRVPMRGEIVPAPVEAHEFEVVDADPRRIGKLRVRRRETKDETPKTQG
jgi:CBS domain containing-hemolysin-like protein